MNFDIEQWKKDRNAALTSMELPALREYALKWCAREIAKDDELLLFASHKARTACKEIPTDLRRESKAWLAARGMQSLDDGDL